MDKITIERETLKWAIDVLERLTTSETFYKDPRGDTAGPTIDSLRAAQAKQADQRKRLTPTTPAQPADSITPSNRSK